MWLRRMKEKCAVAVSLGASQYLAAGREKTKETYIDMADRMMFRTVADGQSCVRPAKEYARDFRVI